MNDADPSLLLIIVSDTAVPEALLLIRDPWVEHTVAVCSTRRNPNCKSAVLLILLLLV